ncbi:hypothetical protein SAMN05428978_10544 [Nitrosomonas sp. Nm34]|nr:hypothetical protein SAMN05428978_10544 [Nitrosomonas sp. Nm34]
MDEKDFEEKTVVKAVGNAVQEMEQSAQEKWLLRYLA